MYPMVAIATDTTPKINSYLTKIYGISAYIF